MPWFSAGEEYLLDEEEGTFAEGVLIDFNPDARGIEIAPSGMLNSERVPDGHRYAVLDEDGETVATAPTRQEAIEKAAREVLRAWARRAEQNEYRLRRVLAAVKTIETGGAE
jgi:hypothetical protein